MIQAIKLLLFIHLFISCKNNTQAFSETNNLSSEVLVEDNLSKKKLIDTKEKSVFSFFKSFPFCENDAGFFTQEEADVLFKNQTFDIENKKTKTVNFSDILSEELKGCVLETLSLEKKVHFEEINTALDFPLNKLYLIDKKFILTFQDGFFFIFHKNEKLSIKDRIEYDVASLPIEFNPYSENSKKIKTPKSIKLKDNSYKDSYVIFLPKFKKFNPIILSKCYELGNCDEYLVVLNKEMDEISRLKLHYNEAPDGNVEKYSYSTYKIDKHYKVEVIKYNVTENQKTINKTEFKSSYSINSKGLILKQ